MVVKVQFEYGQEDRFSEVFSFDGEAVQLTYNELRIAPSGETIAVLSNILWEPLELEYAQKAGLPATLEQAWEAIEDKKFSDVIAWVEAEVRS